MEPGKKAVDPVDNYWKLIGDDGEAVEFDPALFCRENLQSCNFFLYPEAAGRSRRADSLVTIIQGNGGIVLDEPDNHSITLLDLRYMWRHAVEITDEDTWPHDLFSSNFIDDSVKNGSIADLEQYRLTASKYTKYDPNDILMKKRGWDDLMPIGSGSLDELKDVGTKDNKTGNTCYQNNNNADIDLSNLELDGNRNDDESSVNGDSSESVITDTPAVPAGKVKKVPVDGNGLPILPKRIQQNKVGVAIAVAKPKTRPNCATTSSRVPLTADQNAGFDDNVKENGSHGSRTQPQSPLQLQPLQATTPRSTRKRCNFPGERANEPCSSKQARMQYRNTLAPPKYSPVRRAHSRPRALSSSGSSTCSGEEGDEPQAPANREGSVEVEGGRKEAVAPPPSPIANINIISEDDEVNEEDFEEANNHRSFRSAKNGRPFTRKDDGNLLPMGTTFSAEEDHKILRTVMKYNWYANHGSVSIWRWMEQNTELNFRRTHQSLKNRFRRYIIPNLRQFNLSDGQRRAFAEADKQIRKGIRPKAYIPPLPKSK